MPMPVVQRVKKSNAERQDDATCINVQYPTTIPPTKGNVMQFSHKIITRCCFLTCYTAHPVISLFALVVKGVPSSTLTQTTLPQQHHDGAQHHLRPVPGFPATLCPTHPRCLPTSGRGHPVPGLPAGFSRQPVCGLVRAVPGEETLSHLPAGAQPGSGRCLRAAQRSLLFALPGWWPGLGVWDGSLQAGALPVQRQHVRLHLLNLSDEPGPLARRH